MTQQQTIFTEGLRVFKMSQNAPDWMKCELVFNLNEFYAWAQQHQGQDGSVRATVCASSKGSLYAKLNTFVPQQQVPTPAPLPAPVAPAPALQQTYAPLAPQPQPAYVPPAPQPEQQADDIPF